MPRLKNGRFRAENGTMADGGDVVQRVPPDEVTGSSPRRSQWSLILPLFTVVVAVVPAAFLHAGLETPLGEQKIFIPVMLALVGCFDVLSVALLVAQFRDSGQLRVLALAWAFAFSFVTVLGWAAAFPGVFGTPGPLGTVPSTTPWLWVAWHTGFPVLLALAMAPWPRRVPRHVAAGRRRLLAWSSVSAVTAGSMLLVAAVVVLAHRLPVLIQGTDTTAITVITGPVVLPVVAAAAVLTIIASWRRSGAERWAGLAAAAALGDVVLTLFSYHRFSVGWYAGRTMTIISAAVLLFAMLGESHRAKRRLRVQLEHSDRLERLQHTLLSHMADGVVMQAHSGRVVASNEAAQAMLEMTTDQRSGSVALDPRPRALRPDGTPWGGDESPPRATLRTGVGQRGAIVGLETADGSVRWLSLDTVPVRHPSGAVEFVVTTMSDVTQQHDAELVAARRFRARFDRIETVLQGGGPSMVFQPIVELSTGTTVGVEALARFPGEPSRPPDQWFAEATGIGLGIELEMSAIRAALAQLDRFPADTYMSVNVSARALCSSAFGDLLTGGGAARILVELTEQSDVDDYDRLCVALDDLRSLGARLAVDDTGAGFASLQRIINLRPDVIKLDRALVTGIDADPARRALAGAMLAFAREIGATVVAEGIENARENTAVRRLGIRYGQGYHLGRPSPAPLADQEETPVEAQSSGEFQTSEQVSLA